MTNVEIMQQEASQLLEADKLDGRSKEFISEIIKYDKKRLKKLSSKQYHWLRDIVRYTE